MQYPIPLYSQEFFHALVQDQCMMYMWWGGPFMAWVTGATRGLGNSTTECGHWRLCELIMILGNVSTIIIKGWLADLELKHYNAFTTCLLSGQLNR